MSSPQSKQTCYSQELHTAQQWTPNYNRANHASKKLQTSDIQIDNKANNCVFLLALHTAQWWTKLQLHLTKMQQTHPFKNITNKLKTWQENRE